MASHPVMETLITWVTWLNRNVLQPTRARMGEMIKMVEHYWFNNFVLHPDGNTVYYWRGTVTLAVMYNCWMIILRIAFSELRETPFHQTIFVTLDAVCDVVYVLDILVHLRIAGLENGILVKDPDKLGRPYRKSARFLLDVITLLPFGPVAIYRLGEIPWMGLCDMVKASILVPMVRVPRLLKYHTMRRFFEVTDSRTSNPTGVRAFKLALYLGILIHWIGCAYYMISEYEGLGSNDWVYKDTEKGKPRFINKYIRVMYWSTMTLTTIGGLADPITNIEFVFTGFTFMVGVFVFAAVVGNVGDVISNMNAARREFQQRMDALKWYMTHRKVPEHLQDRIKRWADYSWTRTQSADEGRVLDMLPDRLRSEIAINVHLDTLKKVKIFEECEEGLLRELVLKLRPQIFSPGDFICRTGEIGREMYIINHGKIEILVNTPEVGYTVVATLSEGNYFGEISILKLESGQNKRTADVRSVGFSELLCLSRKDLLTALMEYPDAKRILEQQAMERIQRNLEAVRRSSEEGAETNNNLGGASGELGLPQSGAQESKDTYTYVRLMRYAEFRRLIFARDESGADFSRSARDLDFLISQETKDRTRHVATRCQELEEELMQRDEELKSARMRINRLESMVLANSTRSKRRFSHPAYRRPRRRCSLAFGESPLSLPSVCATGETGSAYTGAGTPGRHGSPLSSRPSSRSASRTASRAGSRTGSRAGSRAASPGRPVMPRCTSPVRQSPSVSPVISRSASPVRQEARGAAQNVCIVETTGHLTITTKMSNTFLPAEGTGDAGNRLSRSLTRTLRSRTRSLSRSRSRSRSTNRTATRGRRMSVAVPGISINGIVEQAPSDVTVQRPPVRYTSRACATEVVSQQQTTVVTENFYKVESTEVECDSCENSTNDSDDCQVGLD